MNPNDAALKQAREILNPMHPAVKAHYQKIGAKGGAATSAAKAKSAKKNGKKGGRPPGKAK